MPRSGEGLSTKPRSSVSFSVKTFKNQVISSWKSQKKRDSGLSEKISVNSGSVAGGQSPSWVSGYGFSNQASGNLTINPQVAVNSSLTITNNTNPNNSQAAPNHNLTESSLNVQAQAGGNVSQKNISVAPTGVGSGPSANLVGESDQLQERVDGREGVGKKSEHKGMNKNMEIYQRFKFISNYYLCLRQFNFYNKPEAELVPNFPLNPFFYRRQSCHTMSEYKQQILKKDG